jgi:hypothetical protein
MGMLYGWPLWLTVVVAFLWTPALVLLHELGHALTALDMTEGRVCMKAGSPTMVNLRVGRLELALSPWPGFGGSCEYEPDTLRGSPRGEAWIVVAGPVTSLLTGVVLAFLAAMAQGMLREVLVLGAALSGIGFLLSGLPLRYGRGLGGGESDGTSVWRILTGEPPGPERERPEPVVARPIFLVVLALAGILAFAADPLLGLALVGLFSLAVLYHAADG